MSKDIRNIPVGLRRLNAALEKDAKMLPTLRAARDYFNMQIARGLTHEQIADRIAEDFPDITKSAATVGVYIRFLREDEQANVEAVAV